MNTKIVGKPVNIKSFWIIWECPECNRPNLLNKWVNPDGEVLLNQEYNVECEHCDARNHMKIEMIKVEA